MTNRESWLYTLIWCAITLTLLTAPQWGPAIDAIGAEPAKDCPKPKRIMA